MNDNLQGLGSSGSEGLERTQEGIIAHENPYFGLLNYPILIQFSGHAIRKMDFEWKKNSNSSTIDVYAVMKSGKKIATFSINPTFFGRVQNDRETLQPWVNYKVESLKYDSHLRSFILGNNYRENYFPERSLGSFKPQEKIEKDDVIISFEAKYCLGHITANQIHNFENKFLSSRPLQEELVLRMDTKEDNSWDLQMV